MHETKNPTSKNHSR